MPKFTPGEWIIEKGEADIFIDGDWFINPPLGHDGPIAIVNSEENARLLIAAPRMYEALKGFIDLFPWPVPRKMISKAEKILAEIDKEG